MIVLDEQLLGRGLEIAIARWYPGTVCFITDLRPGTVIKDDAIPAILSGQREPTFITINESDFWQRVAITNRFAMVCIAFPDDQAEKVSVLLQRLLRHEEFRTKALRMGKVARLTQSTAHSYSVTDPIVHQLY